MNDNTLAIILGVAAGLALGGAQYRLLLRMLPRSGVSRSLWALPVKLCLWAAALILGLALAGPAFALALAGAATALYAALGAVQFFRSR